MNEFLVLIYRRLNIVNGESLSRTDVQEEKLVQETYTSVKLLIPRACMKLYRNLALETCAKSLVQVCAYVRV